MSVGCSDLGIDYAMVSVCRHTVVPHPIQEDREREREARKQAWLEEKEKEREKKQLLRSTSKGS